jgi:4'-phosphopantetheinyl transferase
VPVKKKCDVQVWRASPGDVDHAQWRALTKSLSLSERFKAFQFRFEADRKAYVLAHGLRRLALAVMLDVQPEKLVFRDNDKGQPQLIEPHRKRIFFSHTHTREGVLFAASTDAAVGVDAESAVAEPLDFTLLDPYLVLPEIGGPEAASFNDYWTALEAFWKAVGTGLATQHPRLQLSTHPLGHWEVALDVARKSELPTLAAQGVIFSITSPPGCVASLAIIRPGASGTAVFVVHEKEMKKDSELIRRFFTTGSATGHVSRAPKHLFSQS